MMDKKIHNEQLEDMIKIQSESLTLSDIESIARNFDSKKHYDSVDIKSFYSSILLSLTHEVFAEEEAKELWIKITDHMKSLEDKLGRKTGITVASLDYLTNIKDVLDEPKIIEEEKSDYVSEFSTVDELTGLYLRDVFDVTFSKQFYMHTKTKKPFSLLMLDIDDFKQVNDKYGHQKGDEVLKEIGKCINKTIRDMDIAARYGGEEMAIIMPGLCKNQAFNVGERIREAIQELQFNDFRVTVSIGASEIETDSSFKPKDLLNNADSALYKAKKAGKNQTVVWDTES